MINKGNISLLSILLVIGFVFRVVGILENHSFWPDESFVAAYSKSLILNDNSIQKIGEIVKYQPGQVYSNVLMFGLFGYSERAARIPSVMWGTLGIVVVYLLAKKLSNEHGGLLAAFIQAILQVNLSYSTQAKPYIPIQTLFLITTYLTLKLVPDKKQHITHISIILLSILSTLYNYIGFIAFLPYLSFLVISYKKSIISSQQKIIVYLCISTAVIIATKAYLFLPSIFSPKYFWISYTRDLLWRQYAFISLSAIFGLFLLREKYLKIGLVLSLTSLLYVWNFIQYSHNIRYLVPLFGLMVVLFSVFWARVGERLFKNSALVCLAVALLIYGGGYKVVRKPATYYTPNADFTSDVQNADYKRFFKLAYEKFPDFDQLPVFSDVYDSFPWYTHKKPEALFMRTYDKPTEYSVYPVTIYPNLDYFLREKAKYSKGLLVVEDWYSFLPEDIKEYAKKNMKLELRVESMEVSPNDKWPLELYSWGFDNMASSSSRSKI